ncbi:hypothetical protein [Paucisalibacillus sp. EB02]|uniref:hypothetical protein n=1 Tax=Paucisalibacillus sp. EB02 TaxID=1347087 RepID=UPI0004B3F57D|nr:hypothetical protein [Paucisalibacillus sp. EB02]
MAAFLSILPLIFIMIIILWLVAVNKRLTRKSLTLRQSKLIFVGYISFLLIATVFSLFLPSSEAKLIKNLTLREDMTDNLFMKAQQGGFSSIDQQRISQSWEFPYTGDSLTLSSDYYDEGILIERTNELKGKIEVYFIKDWQALGVNSVSMDVSEYTPDMDVEMTSDTLMVVSPEEELIIELAFSELAFPMKQMIGESQFGHGYSSSGSRFFYIRVPQDLQIEFSEYLYVDYVNN